MMRRNPLSGKNQVALGPLSSFFAPSEQFRPEGTENVTLNHLVQKFGVTGSVRSLVKWSETNQFRILSDFRNELGKLLLMLKNVEEKTQFSRTSIPKFRTVRQSNRARWQVPVWILGDFVGITVVQADSQISRERGFGKAFSIFGVGLKI